LATGGVQNRRVTTLREASDKPFIRLVCIPCAGGNPEIFLPWTDLLSRGIELLAVRLPGHGPRIADAPFGQWDDLLADTLEGLAGYLSEPYALYGHCFGARLAYELTHSVIAGVGRLQPKRLFVSACRSPDVPHAGIYVHELEDREFCGNLRQLGASDEVIQNSSIMKFVLPAVRSEIRLAELWNDRHRAPVQVPITAIYGRDDPEDGRRSMEGWREFSTKECELVEMPGDRSFLTSHCRMLLDVVNSRLETVSWSS
jgi:medium-chain acyl-[acyl-carrier-protein] hydrolase